MNKKGFIAGMSLWKLGIFIVFGLGTWFIYSSAKDVIVDKYGSTPMTTLLMGVFIVAGILIFYKFKLHNLVLK